MLAKTQATKTQARKLCDRRLDITVTRKRTAKHGLRTICTVRLGDALVGLAVVSGKAKKNWLRRHWPHLREFRAGPALSLAKALGLVPPRTLTKLPP